MELFFFDFSRYALKFSINTRCHTHAQLQARIQGERLPLIVRLRKVSFHEMSGERVEFLDRRGGFQHVSSQHDILFPHHQDNFNTLNPLCHFDDIYDIFRSKQAVFHRFPPSQRAEILTLKTRPIQEYTVKISDFQLGEEVTWWTKRP